MSRVNTALLIDFLNHYLKRDTEIQRKGQRQTDRDSQRQTDIERKRGREGERERERKGERVLIRI